MPNWCKGTLRLRGTLKELKTFIEQGCEVNGSGNGKLILLHYDDTGFRYSLDDDPYIKSTRRAFLTGEEIYTVKDHQITNMYILVCEFQQAWNVETDEFKKIAQQYHLDVKIDAFERGSDFSRQLIIVDNTVIKNETRTYANYAWECVCPMIGG